MEVITRRILNILYAFGKSRGIARGSYMIGSIIFVLLEIQHLRYSISMYLLAVVLQSFKFLLCKYAGVR